VLLVFSLLSVSIAVVTRLLYVALAPRLIACFVYKHLYFKTQIAIVAFAFQEAVSKVPVVKETPALFGLTPDEKIAETEIGEVAQASFSVLEYALHRLHLI
jgi:hypothetical protein